MKQARSVMKAASLLLFLPIAVISQVKSDHYDALEVWSRHDSENYHRFVRAITAAQNAHEVALAIQKNGEGQRQTVDELLRFASSHPEIRDAAQLGLDKEGQRL